jgi:hypothetical protein
MKKKLLRERRANKIDEVVQPKESAIEKVVKKTIKRTKKVDK